MTVNIESYSTKCRTAGGRITINDRSGITGWGAGAQCPPDIFHQEIFVNREKRGYEKRENGEEKKENCKGRRKKM